jgi:hypothetical protein
MNDFFNAIWTVIKLLGGVAIYTIFMIPLTFLCYILAILLIPLDLLVLIFSWGELNFEILKSFKKAARTSIMWFRNNYTE